MLMHQTLTKSLCCLLLYLISAIGVQAETFVGKVVGITDGDTITVIDTDKTEHKIRLMGIDAPEKKQDYGIESKKALSNYIYQREITVEYKKQDRYKRNYKWQRIEIIFNSKRRRTSERHIQRNM